MTKNQTVKMLLIFLAVFLAVFLAFKSEKLLVQKQPASVTPHPDLTKVDTQDLIYEPVGIAFESNEIVMVSGKENRVSVEFKELPIPVPTAVTLQLFFDPEKIVVKDVEEGLLWTETNLLLKSIDNETGELVFSYGQGFGASVANRREIAKIVFESTVNSGDGFDTELVFGEESYMASTDVDKLIGLEGESLVIQMIE